MSIQSVAFKRGTSFSAHAAYTPLAGQPADLSGVSVASQVRTAAGDLVESLTVATDTDFLGFTLASAGTAAWPLGVLSWDLRLANGSSISYTQTVRIVVEPGVTQ